MKSNCRYMKMFIVSLISVMFLADNASCDNIDPNEDGSQYAYCQNIGWLNFEPNQGPGVTVSNANLTGYVWAENIGWINLDPNFGGVTNDGTGLLSGYAWGENVGWINFNPEVAGDPNHYGVTIDHDGNFDGWAWGENIGWIHFRSTTPPLYKVQTSWITSCVVEFDDFARFAENWLWEDCNELNDWCSGADLNQLNGVNGVDLRLFVEQWLCYCPAGWPLK